MIKKDFRKVTGIISSENGKEIRFQTTKELTAAILAIDNEGDEVSEIVINGKAEGASGHFKFWKEKSRPNWGCVQVDETVLNQEQNEALKTIKDIVKLF